MKPCDHTVGWNGSYGADFGAQKASETTQSHRADEEFDFCPDCGASLDEFYDTIHLKVA